MPHARFPLQLCGLLLGLLACNACSTPAPALPPPPLSALPAEQPAPATADPPTTATASFNDGQPDSPVLPGDTVLSVLSRMENVDELTQRRLWLVRPTGAGDDDFTILPIDYPAIVADSSGPANYAMQQGDRIYASLDPDAIRQQQWEERVAGIIEPTERVFGAGRISGPQTIQNLQRFPRDNQRSNF